jgi:aspartate/methionine/tyrosine aminotransferase
VAVTPGCDFGTHRADMHLRFAYTRSIEELEEGVERIARYIGSR